MVDGRAIRANSLVRRRYPSTTGFRRRRDVHPEWSSEWEKMFVYSSSEPTPPEVLERIKAAYNEILAHLVGDIEITAARTDYSTARLVLNA